MIEHVVETKARPEQVWQLWYKAHGMHAGFKAGQKGVRKADGGGRFSYKILDVREGQSFTILWKTLFVGLVFSHEVLPKGTGSTIRYQVQIRGLFAAPVRWFLGKKIKHNLSIVLHALARELELSR